MQRRARVIDFARRRCFIVSVFSVLKLAGTSESMNAIARAFGKCWINVTTMIVGLMYGTLPAQETEVYVDAGACPGEGCEYCALYVAKSDIAVYEKSSIESKQVGVIAADDTFISKTGEVHTVPTRFEVHREHDGIRPGDDVFALTYLGEGYYRILLNGDLTRADLGFSPWGGSASRICDKPRHCWGRLEKELEFTWWMWVISESSLAGWVVANESMRQIDNR